MAAVAVILILAVANNNPTTHNAAQQVINLGQNTGQQTGTNGYVNVQKPMLINCYLALPGSTCGAATIALYQGSSALQLETGTMSAAGAYTTATYASGTSLTAKISGATCSTTCITEYLPFTVPQMDPNSAISSATNGVSVYEVTLGAWTITNVGSAGTTFTSGGTYYISQFSGNTVTVTTTLSETTANAGWKSSYDTTNLLNQYLITQVTDGAGASSSTQYATFTGAPHTAKSGSTNYYFWTCPDGISGSGVGTAFSVVQNSMSAGSADGACSGSLSAQTIGNTLKGGTAAFQWTLGLGSLTTGNLETFSIKTFDDADWAYFAANGNLGPNAAQLGSTFTIGIQK